MRRISLNEDRRLVKVEVYNDGNTWTLQWERGHYVFRGNEDQFRRFLIKIQAADTREEPRSYRSMRWKDLAYELANGVDRHIWVWKHMLPTKQID